MAITGHDGSYPMRDVEVINLSGGGQTCEKPSDYPHFFSGSTGVYYEGYPTVCGGKNPNCYKYTVQVCCIKIKYGII